MGVFLSGNLSDMFNFYFQLTAKNIQCMHSLLSVAYWLSYVLVCLYICVCLTLLFLFSADREEHPVYALPAQCSALSWLYSRHSLASRAYHTTGTFIPTTENGMCHSGFWIHIVAFNMYSIVMSYSLKILIET